MGLVGQEEEHQGSQDREVVSKSLCEATRQSWGYVKYTGRDDDHRQALSLTGPSQGPLTPRLAPGHVCAGLLGFDSTPGKAA